MVPIPTELMADSIPPSPPQPFNWRASLEWNEQLLNTIGQCNLDKSGIRKIEALRR
ncbi:Rz1-like lysis system protein LysC [Mixta intestinalis]|uniref:Rz1-like lysis system protein LysC n=1 Tax=Mixta intestinalis TaxID=1615494 RepID=UPI003CC796E0